MDHEELVRKPSDGPGRQPWRVGVEGECSDDKLECEAGTLVCMRIEARIQVALPLLNLIR